MDYYVIDRCANACRKRIAKWIWKILKSRDSPIVSYEFLRNLIQLKRGNTRLDMLSNLTECFTDKSVSITHQSYFIFCLKKYLHSVQKHDKSIC